MAPVFVAGTRRPEGPPGRRHTCLAGGEVYVCQRTGDQPLVGGGQ